MTPTARPSLAKRLALAAASPLVFLGLLELVLRLIGFQNPSLDAPLIVWNLVEDIELAEEDSLHTSDVRQLWVPRPGAVVGEDVINARGYRGPELPLEPTEGKLRIATLGDSSTFGFRVAWEECYSARIVETLAASGVDSEVLCAGVIGYTVRQGIERYRELVRPHRPDVVIAAFGAVNEHHLAQGGQSDDAKIAQSVDRDSRLGRTRRWLRTHARVFHLLGWAIEGGDAGRLEVMKGRRAARERESSLHRTMGEVDWAGVRRVGEDEFPQLLLRLRDEVEADGARFLAISMPRSLGSEKESPVLTEYTRRLNELAVEGELEVVSAHRAFHELALPDPQGFDLLLDIVHPSPGGHHLIARLVAGALLDEDGDG